MSTHFDPERDSWNNAELAPFISDDIDDAQWMLLSAYADGETTPEESAQAQELLRTNQRIAHAFALLKTASHVATSQPQLEPPPTLRTAIRTATTLKPTLSRRIAAAFRYVQGAFMPAPARLALAGSALAGMALLAMWGRIDYHSVNTTPERGVVAKVTPHQPSIPGEPVRPGRHDKPGITANPRMDVASLHRRKRTPAPETGAETRSDLWSPAELALNSVSPMPERMETAVRKPADRSFHAGGGQSVKKQRPLHDERRVSDPNDEFNILPNMDRENQTSLTRADMKPVGGADNGIELIAGERPMPAGSTIHVDPAVATSSASAPRLIRVTRLAQLPTDTRRFLPTADIRRAMEARNLYLNTVALEGIHRGQASVALFSSRF